MGGVEAGSLDGQAAILLLNFQSGGWGYRGKL